MLRNLSWLILAATVALGWGCKGSNPPETTNEAEKSVKKEGAATPKATEPSQPDKAEVSPKEVAEPAVEPPKADVQVQEDATQTEGEKTHARDTRKKDELVTSPNAPSGGEEVVAWSNQRRISKEEFERYLLRLPPFQRQEYAALKQKMELLKNLIKFDTVAQLALEAGLDQDPEVQLALKTEMVKMYIQRNFGDPSKVEVTDAELEARYQKESSRYNKPARVRASHILIRDESLAREVLEKMKERLAQPKSNARRIFREFVRRYSEDEESKQRGGDLLYLTLDGKSHAELDQAVVEAAFSMQNLNQISTLIRGERGYHIVMVTDRREKVEQSFDDVKETLREQVAQDKLDAARKVFMDRVVDMNDWHMETAVLDSIIVDGLPASHSTAARVKSVQEEIDSKKKIRSPLAPPRKVEPKEEAGE